MTPRTCMHILGCTAAVTDTVIFWRRICRSHRKHNALAPPWLWLSHCLPINTPTYFNVTCHTTDALPRAQCAQCIQVWQVKSSQWCWQTQARKVFRIGTVSYNWPMPAHASQAFSIAHCTDSEHLPQVLKSLYARINLKILQLFNNFQCHTPIDIWYRQGWQCNHI